MTRTFFLGNKGEEYLINLLNNLGFEAKRNRNKKSKNYDLFCKLKSKKFTIEVKYDAMAQDTGNLAIEYHNCKADEASGLEVTTAKIWAHLIKDGDNLTVWVCPVEKLKKFVKNNEPWKDLKGVGDNNACIYLYRIDDIISEFDRIDNVEQKQVFKIMRRLLK